MRKSVKRKGAIAVLLSLGGSPAALAEAGSSAPPVAIGNMIINARYLDQAIANGLREFRRAASDRRNLSRSDLTLAAAIDDASTRSNAIAQVFAYDVDGDGVILSWEVDRVLAARAKPIESGEIIPEHYRPPRTADIFAADVNGDGKIEWDEAIAYATTTARSSVSSRPAPREVAEALLSLDPDKDGVLTVDEAESVLRQAFTAIDVDGSKEISPQEAITYGNTTRGEGEAIRKEREVVRQVSGCVWRDLPQGAAVSAAIAPGGAGLSAASLVGQDWVTTAVQVEIAEGDEPLNLLFGASEPVVWKVTGAVDRVQRVALTGPPRGYTAGVAGVDAAKVSTLPPGACFVEPYDARPSAIGAATEAMHRMLRSAGAKPLDVSITRDKLFRVRFPGALMEGQRPQPEPPPEGMERGLWQTYQRMWPGGLVSVDAAQVAGTAKAVGYELSPDLAGLVQLVAEGTLQSDTSLPLLAFQVLRPMKRVPAVVSLGGMMAVFRQPSSFPVPTGPILAYCGLDIETGKAIFGDNDCDGMIARARGR